MVFGARGNNALINNDGSGGVLTMGSTIFVHGYSGSIANSSAGRRDRQPRSDLGRSVLRCNHVRV